MNINDFCNNVNKLWWDDHPPTKAPRHIFALYVAAYEAGLTPEQFLKFMSARNFTTNITVVLENEEVEFIKSQKFLELHHKDTDLQKAIKLLFSKEEVKDEYKSLFDT